MDVGASVALVVFVIGLGGCIGLYAHMVYHAIKLLTNDDDDQWPTGGGCGTV